MDWSAAQYRRFEAERTRPCAELLARVPTDPVAHARSTSAAARATRPSSSPRAGRRPRSPASTARPTWWRRRGRGCRASAFDRADIAAWDDPGPFDVILANAVLQWLPDHERLLPSLVARLAPGGSLAVQVPDNLDEPSHRLMREVAADGPWAARIGDAAVAARAAAPAGVVRRLLHGAGAASTSGAPPTTTRSPGAAGVVEWLKATGLRPFLAPLDEEEPRRVPRRATRRRSPRPTRRCRTARCCCRSRGSSSSRPAS